MMDNEYVVYRGQNRIMFVYKDYQKIAELKIKQAKQARFVEVPSLTYLSAYVVDTRTNTMIKNIYPDKDWPEEVFNEIFSGVSNATYI